MTKTALFYLLACCCALHPAFAQTVLTAIGVNPAIGDKYTLRQGNYQSPGSGGNGQLWDLSAITATSTSNYTVGTLASAPAASQFTAGSNIQMNDGTIYNFFHASAAAYRNSGSVAGSTITIAYSDAEDVLHFPFNYTDSFSDSWAATFTLSNISFTRNGSSSVIYDGAGSLQLSTGLFSNVARVHLVQNYSDVSAFNTTTYVNDQYLWFVNGHHQPLAGVFSTTINGTAASQGGFYSPDTTMVTSIPETGPAVFPLRIFPNPASETIHLVAEQTTIGRLELFDATGRMVYSETVSPASQAASIAVGHIPAGIYLLRATAPNGRLALQKIALTR